MFLSRITTPPFFGEIFSYVDTSLNIFLMQKNKKPYFLYNLFAHKINRKDVLSLAQIIPYLILLSQHLDTISFDTTWINSVSINSTSSTSRKIRYCFRGT